MIGKYRHTLFHCAPQMLQAWFCVCLCFVYTLKARPSTSKKATTRFVAGLACFIALVRNRACNISEVCLQFSNDAALQPITLSFFFSFF